MSIKLELDADSIKQAISAHISSQGFNLEGKHVDVALVNGRGGNGNRATVTITEQTANTTKYPKTAEEAITYHPEVEEVVLPDVEVEETIPVISQGEVEVKVIAPDNEALERHTDNIMAAAESSSDPFVEMVDEDSLFPTVNPAEVETSKSLF